METASSSVIVLDSDSDSEGAPARHGKRKSSVITSVGSVKQSNGSGLPRQQQQQQSPTASNVKITSEEPARKRIKPITVATNLSARGSPNGVHNNNNRASIESAGQSENFAQITFSEDWEQEMKQYQSELNGQSRKRPASSAANAVVVLDDPPETLTSPTRSSSTTTTTINDDPERIDGRPLKIKQQAATAGKVEKNPIGPEFQQLLDACRKADPSKEMELLIQKRLIRYYEIVHPDYVNSRSFKKAVAATVIDVQTHPNLVFLKLSGIVEELNARRKSRAILEPTPATTVAATTTTTSSTTNGGNTADGNDSTPSGQSSTAGKDARKDQQIARLNRTLYCLKKRIQMLEEAEVDFNHDANSAYMMVQRYKKRAFDVYKKLCDITGESKDAHRLVKKPIHFQGTPYTEFNRTIQLFVNRTDSFPDFRDVLKCLQHCDEKYGYNLRREQMDRVAQDAFLQVGKLLQKRRKTDLYETVSYYANDATDPALADQKLQEKLDQNRKYYNKVGELIDKFAKAEANNEIEVFEDLPLPEDYPEAVLAKSAVDGGGVKESKTEQTQPSKSSSSSSNSGSSSSSSNSSSSGNSTSGTNKKDTVTNRTTSVAVTDDSAKVLNADVTDSEEEDEDEDEEDDEEDEEEDDEEQTTKENVQPDCFEDIVISDDEELLLPES